MVKTDSSPAAEDGTARLRPRARIMRTLGDELISSEAVALIELVKNAYDADATRVIVRFQEPLERGQGGIDVIDDGHGMTRDTILGTFLEPATSFRRDHRRSEEFQRIVTGEKGIGRFAVSRLADELELVSRRPGAPTETHVLFDWSAFDNPDAYLDEVDVAWESVEPQEITPSGIAQDLWSDHTQPPIERLNRGTCLRMTRLRSRWGRAELEALRTRLSRLISPFLFEQQLGSKGSFSIVLEAPSAFPDLRGPVEPSEALQQPHYSLRGNVDADGNYDITLKIRDQLEPISRRARIPFEDHKPTTGPFTVEFRVWDRDRTSLEELGTSYGQVRNDLDQAAGVNVYRDGFRVLPYGEPGDDWLGLDRRRVQNPTLRLSNNQVVGYVLVSSDANPDLRDQTNREGLLRNAAFEDLVRSLRELVGELEQARYASRPRPGASQRPGQGGLFSAFDLAPVREYVVTRYPKDAALAELVSNAERSMEQSVTRVQEVVARYRRLATLGELIDKVLHDGRTPLAKIGNEAVLGLRDIERRGRRECEDLVERLRNRLDQVHGQHDVLATVFRRIEPFGGRKRGRPSQLVLEGVIADSFGVLTSDIERIGATVTLPETTTQVTVDRAELQEIIVNLLDNSLHWLTHVPRSKRKIEVTVDRDTDGVHILFSDSGPGVRDDARNHIFDPYYSTKPDGIGLGLNIAGEIVDEYYGGQLQLLDSGPLPGATFRVTLRRRV